ncbi:hypothetical protein PV325_001161 [Microctonus aethiopoides]|nr:hypothetical protein PV325_001161 [Microctonus aethiopoides]
MSASKRRKITSVCWEARDGRKTRSKIFTLDTLPPEVLEMVLKFLPFQIVATSVRLVSRHCMMVATSVLNGAFFSAGHRLDAAMNYTETSMSIVKNETDLLASSRAFNILELIRTQYKMLRAVTWRYTHPPRPEKFSRLCFYAGSLLDELNNILYLARTRPAALIGSHGPDSNVTGFLALCKRFMNYFEKVSERRSALVSGCKAVDVLDCLAEGRQLLGFRLTTGRGNRGHVLCMQLRYVMRRAWFTCLEVPCAADETSWRDEQRFMYLRLRRLVGSVNEHHYERIHYERELMLNSRTWPSPRPPLASTYSGYGEYGGQFYYYGNMNKYAYANKFSKPAESEDSEEQDENTSDDVRTTPTFDLVVGIELRCSPELAPLAVRSVLKSDDVDNRPISHNPEMYLKMNITCPASIANRLPGHFTWEQRAPRRGHYNVY